MYDDTTRTTFNSSDPGVLNSVPVGTTVYDVNGDKVGSVAEYDSQSGYMVVEKGWLFNTDLYVPLTLIANTDDQGLYLKVTKDDLKADQYTSPPTGYDVNAGDAAGYSQAGVGSTVYDPAGTDVVPPATQEVGTGYGSASSRDVAATTGGYTGQVSDADATTTAAGYSGTTASRDLGASTPGYTGQVSDVQNQDLGAGTVAADQASPTNTINYAGQPSVQDQGTGTTTWNNQTTGAANQATFGTASADIQVPVREEELVTGTRVEEEGRVRIHKEVVEEQETVTVPVRRERVVVERVPATGEIDANAVDATAFKEDDIEIPVMREEAVVGKRVQGVENVRIHKDVVTDNEQVSDTVRKERVVVDGADDDTDQTDTNTTYRR
jgi:uncharacterized protein (TIGR02271 family)